MQSHLPHSEEQPYHYSHAPSSSAMSSSRRNACCRFLLKLLHCFGDNEPESPRNSRPPQPEQRYQQQYQPNSGVEALAPVSGSSFRESIDAERGRLLPKRSESSAPFERVRPGSRPNSATGSASGLETHSRTFVGGSPTAMGGTGQQSRARNVPEGKHGRLKGITTDSPAEMQPTETGKLPAMLMAPNQQDEDDDLCPTCLEQYTVENPKIFTECGHHFHMQCIYEWLNRKDTCPMCESKMSFPGLL